MKGFVLTSFGGRDKLVWREDLPVPHPGEGEVLIRVSASSVNNTDINARVGWYAKAVTGGTSDAEQNKKPLDEEIHGSWAVNPHLFPRVQGADCCGTLVAVGRGVSPARVGERVLVRACQIKGPTHSPDSMFVFGSGCDGAFAEYAKVGSQDAFAVRSDLTDVELASIPVAYSTAEGMFDRARVGVERLLITGASGGVGVAAVQLAKLRGATVTAVTTREKATALRNLGADDIIERDAPIPARAFDVVVDLVAGMRWPSYIAALRRGGRYVIAGAIAGPHVRFDVRDLYFNDLTFYGSGFQPEHVFPKLVSYIERGEIKPVVAKTFRLEELHAAQEAFLSKTYVGKIGIVVASGPA
jgi:NADPH:quinone reductase-like Zn-dependent oxidoreductase